MARRNVNISVVEKDLAMIIFTNRMKKARKLANLLIRFRVGYRAAVKMTEKDWTDLAHAGGWEEVGPVTRRITLRMLAVRWKVKLEGVWL